MSGAIAGLTLLAALAVAGWALKTAAAPADTTPRLLAWFCAALAPVAVLVALGAAIGLAVPGFYGP